MPQDKPPIAPTMTDMIQFLEALIPALRRYAHAPSSTIVRQPMTWFRIASNAPSPIGTNVGLAATLAQGGGTSVRNVGRT